MVPRHYWPLRLFILLSLVGCTALPISLEDATQPGVKTPVPEDGSTSYPIINATPVPGATSETPDTTSPVTTQFVRVWLPPEFDPDRNSAANELLKARLNQFEAMHPGIQLEVRMKALDGPGGMLDSLVATSAAAPDSLPDLVLLPRPLLESAALKGLLYPFDGLTNLMEDKVWFEYALQLAHLKASTYGIPFAGDIMVLARVLSGLESTPLSLEDAITQGGTLLYPAADPQSLFTLCMYLAEGGRLQDNQGRPLLEETPLLNVLDYVQQASLSEVMPYTLTQYSDDSQVWEALLAGQGPMAVTWASSYMREDQVEQANLAMAALPTPDGVPFTLAIGWSWALAGRDSARRDTAVQLAEFMVEKSFMADWTESSGYMPPRVDALQEWPMTPVRQVIEQVSYSAWLAPSEDILSTIGPVLRAAVMDVLTGLSDANVAAKAAVGQVNQP